MAYERLKSRLKKASYRRQARTGFAVLVACSLLAVGSCQTSYPADGQGAAYSSRDMWEGQNAVARNPDSLLDMEALRVRDMLGSPELRRVEAPAQVWQYRTQSCVVDLFLYDSTEEQTAPEVAPNDASRSDTGLRVSHVEMRPHMSTDDLRRTREERTRARTVSARNAMGPQSRRKCILDVIATRHLRDTESTHAARSL